MLRIRVLCLLIVVLVSARLHADNWPQFRGPHFNGFSEETNLPSEFSPTDKVVWSADLPGASAAVPVVWEDRVFVSSTRSSDETLQAICIDRKSGNVIWQKKVGDGLRRDSRSNFAAPSPATDGEVVIFFYGNGPLVAFDMDGKELWRRNIPEDYGDFAFLWTFSTSPLLHDGKLYLQVLQRDTPVKGRGFSDKTNDSYLLALDPKTGEEIFKTVRESKAVSESREAFTTPIPFTHNGREELLIVGGDALSGHDPDTGEEIWRWGTWNPDRIGHWRLVPSPVAGKGVILACAPKKQPVYAIKAGGAGELTDDAIAWTSVDPKVVSSDVPTPAFAYGDFFLLNKDRKMLSRIVPETGEIKWQVRIPVDADYEASPTVADGKIYIINFSSRCLVYDVESGEKLGDVQMDRPRDDSVRSAIVAAQGQLFIRTANKLFCIAN